MDKFKFAEEQNTIEINNQDIWKILIVDDNLDIFNTTKQALSTKEVYGKKLEFIYASSKEEAINYFINFNDKDIAVALIDVMMEDNDSGLQLINYIRNTLKNNIIQLIIRTGHPGEFPMLNLYEQYDINNYIEKGANEVSLLYIELLQAIKSYKLSKDIAVKLEGKVKDINNQLFAFMEHTPNFSYIKDNNHKFIIASNKLADIAKSSYKGEKKINDWQDLIGMCDHDIFPKEFADECFEDEKKIFETGIPIINKEKELKSGQEKFFILTTKIPLRDEKGEIYRLLGVGNNITQANSAEILKAQYDTLAHVSHDIRNPINAILGYLELIRNITSTSNEKEEFIKLLKSIEINCEILTELREDIMFLNNTTEIDNVDYDIKSIKTIINSLFELKAKEKKIELRIKIDKKIPNIIIDKNKFRKLVTNLISNAIRFTDKGFVELEINLIKIYEGLVDIEVVVKDTGRGIPEDKINQIFEPFIYYDSPNGGGLGLAIVKKITDLLNGKIEKPISIIDKGSTFKIILNEIKISTSKIIVEELIDISEINKSILVVDDIQSNIDTIKIYLTKSKIKIFEAKNGDDAIQIVKDNHIDLILMDYNMPPGKNGAETAMIIKSDVKNTNIKIVCYSSTCSVEEINQKHDSLFDDCLKKAENKNELYKLLNSFFPLFSNKEPIKYLNNFGSEFPHIKKEIESIKLSYNINNNDSIDNLISFNESLCEIANQYHNERLFNFCKEFKTYLDNYNIIKINDFCNELKLI